MRLQGSLIKVSAHGCCSCVGDSEGVTLLVSDGTAVTSRRYNFGDKTIMGGENRIVAYASDAYIMPEGLLVRRGDSLHYEKNL